MWWIFGPACYILSLVYFAVGHEDAFKVWTEHAHWCLNLKFVALEGSAPINKKEQILILANHRSTMDTLNSDPCTEYSCMYLSRWAVAVAIPACYITSIFTNAVWFFKRGGRGNDLEPFFKWLDAKFASPLNCRPNLCVYPEGHRSHEVTPLPLKGGMIRYAFERKKKVQIYVGKNFDKCVNELKFTLDLSGHTVYYKVLPELDPIDFGSFEEFFKTVEK